MYYNAALWPTLEDEPEGEAVRLSVHSLLLSPADYDLPDSPAQDIAEPRGKRKLSPWGMAVMQEIFRQFNLEYQESQLDPTRNNSDDFVSDDEDYHDALDQVVQIYYDEGQDGIELINQYEPIRRMSTVEEIDYRDPRFTPPLSNRDQINEACCLICSPTRQNFAQHRPLTPPDSPRGPSLKSYLDGCPECQAEAGSSSKSHSIIYAIKRQFRRRTSLGKLRPAPPGSPKIKPITPLPAERPSTPVRRAPSTMTKLSQGDDLRTVLRGPVLKLNRLSDLSLALQLTAEEQEQISQRRALGMHEEEFDLVVRLGIPRPSRGNVLAPFDEPPLPPTNPEDIPPVPMVNPEHLQPLPSTPTAKSSGTTRSKSTSKSGKRPTRLKRTKSSLPPIQTNPETNDSPSKPEIQPPRAALSEVNLAKLVKETGMSPPPIPEAIPMPMLSRAKSFIAPSEDSMSVITTWPVPARHDPMNKRTPLHKYPSVEQIPRAHTTALALQGGRVGVVQMGSANKANKILGDIVLLASEKNLPKRRRERNAPSVARGSVSKVERLRGERIPIERLAPVPYEPAEDVEDQPGLKSPPLRSKPRPKSNGAVWVV
jgi:hypothetical protein